MIPDTQVGTLARTPAPDLEAKSLICDWKDCVIVARFHIEVPQQFSGKLAGDSGERRPFSRTHHNICGAHMDAYSAVGQPTAIYTVGKCPQCDTDRR